MTAHAAASRRVVLYATLALVSPLAVRGQVALLPPWTASISVGAGFAHVPSGRDTVLQSSTLVLVQANGRVRVFPRVFVGAEVTVTPYALVGDCIPGFLVCAPAVRYHSLLATASYSFAGRIARGIPLLTIGAGASLFPSTESRLRLRVPATTVASYTIGLDVPLTVRKRGGLLFGLGMAFIPNSPGGDVTAWSLRLSYRRWPSLE